MTIELVVLDHPYRRAPAYPLATRSAISSGQATLEANGRFVELWQDGDPVARVR